jgi:hypothetical protein
MIYSVLYRSRSSQWLDELSSKIEEDKQTNESIPSSTILALYIRRKFFVSYSNNNNQDELTDSSSSKLKFQDWIDLLLNGNFPDRITITDWPMKFH